MSTPRTPSPDSPYRVMTVCTGNICRSPMDEVVLRHRFEEAGLAGAVVVDSTGTSDEEEGGPVDPRARAALEASGYEVGDHVARQVEPGQVEQRDLVLAMTTAHRRALQRLSPQAAERVVLWRTFDPAAEGLQGAGLDVADPWYGGESDFAVCLEQVEAAADGVVDHVRRALRR